MRIMVTGATGFIGRALCRHLAERGHTVTALTRNLAQARAVLDPGISFLPWGDPQDTRWQETLPEIDAVVNLAGASVGGAPWTPEYKRTLYDSRILTTRTLVDAIGRSDGFPPALISASAVGYYGDRKDEVLTETSAPGTDFLAVTCRDWEVEASRAEEFGCRVARMRIGVALGHGGALEKLLYPLPLPVSPFKLGLGGPIGDGRQWFPWIHLEDVIGMFAWAVTHPTLRGAFNVTSPYPSTNADFVHAIGRLLHRPAVTPVPAFVLKLALGEFAQALLGGQRALPTAAQQAGYTFRHEQLEEALQGLLATL